MDRREFVSTTAAALAVLAGGEMAQAQQAQTGQRGQRGDGRDIYDLRVYSFAKAEQKARFMKFFKEVELPAIKRAEVGPVGVFSVMDKPEDLSLYVLIVHRGQSVLTLGDKLAADTEYQTAGKDFLALSSKDKPFERIDSALLVAFDGIPKLEVPEAKPRIFELRCYESHSATFGLKKIDMFNNGGEIALFRKTGLKPVFFGQMIVGKNCPNLTYMVAFADMKDHDESWKKFIEHPEWKKLGADPKYADTVSNIIKTFLKPEDFSQI